MKGGFHMEVIQTGKENVNEMDSMGCCWPPGTYGLETPE